MAWQDLAVGANEAKPVRRLAFAAVAVAAGMGLAACAPSSTTASTLPLNSYAIVPSTHVDAQLLHAFRTVKLADREMTSTDKIVPAPVYAPHFFGPLEAWDATIGSYVAFAAYRLVGTPSYEAGVSFQDGGSYGIFDQKPNQPWLYMGSPGIPLCPNDLPTGVWNLWHLPVAQGCSMSHGY